MKRFVGLLLASFCFIVANDVGAQEQTDVSSRAELAALDRLVGTWEKEFTVHPSIWTPSEVRMTGTHTAKWILGQHHLQEAGKDGDGKEYLTIYSYDATAKQLKATYFQSSERSTKPMSGEWDSTTDTFIWKSDVTEEIKMTARYHFTDKDSFEFRFTAQDRDGTTYYKLTGTGKRIETDNSNQTDGRGVKSERQELQDAYVGLSEGDARKLAQSQSRNFRVGMRDGVDLPVTSDYRLGRITVSIEKGVVVDVSVEAGADSTFGK